jgi:PAS domain S-box-containing protein
VKTQTKITILLLSVTLIFIAGLIIIKKYESKREELLLKKNIFDKNTLYDRILRVEGSTLEIFTYYSSNTDDIVASVNSNDIDKADRIISPLLSSFHVDAVWIYNSDLNLIYSTKNPSGPLVKDINIHKDFFSTLFSRSFFCHFFIKTPMGVMEIQSAPVQPSTDTYRQTNPQGYLFAGRLWDEKYINELSFLTDSTIELLPIQGKTVFAPIYDIQKGILSFSRIRNGWDEKPLIQIKIAIKTPITKQLRESSQKQFILLLIFTLTIILMMTILLVRWINLPLKKISLSLNQEDPEILKSLKNENTEFGNLARLVLNFFNQKSELETSEERFRSVVQTAADAIICINQHGNIVFWNKEAEYIFGYTYEEIVNKPAYTILSEKHKRDYENLITQLSIGNERNFSGRAIEVSGLKKDGSEFPMELSEASWKTDSGTFITAIARDISERKHAETQLEKSEKRFRDIVENSFTGRFIVQNDRIVYTNTEQNVIFGPVPDNYLFSDFKNIYPEDINKFKDFCDSLLSGNSVPLDIDFRLYPFGKLNSSTHIKWVNCRGNLIDYQGNTALFINMMDITRFMELEQLLRIEDKMSSLGRVAAGIAHEIRNPLSGINSYLYSLKNLADEYQSKKIFKGIIQEIQSASNKIESVIKRVMDFSKPGHPKLTRININDPVLEAINLSMTTLRKSDVTVDIRLASELIQCTADAHMIEQVILNLINNSVQAMSSSGKNKELKISSSANEKSIIIRLSDSGPGIAEEIRDLIFDPFYTTKTDGSGIGLSLCRRIITDHSGSIRIEKSSWGGASFVIELPKTVK